MGGDYGAVVEVVRGLRKGRGGGLGARLGLWLRLGLGRGGVGCGVPIRREEEHYAGLFVRRVDAVAIDAYGSEVDVFGVDVGPPFHEEFGDLGG